MDFTVGQSVDQLLGKLHFLQGAGVAGGRNQTREGGLVMSRVGGEVFTQMFVCVNARAGFKRGGGGMTRLGTRSPLTWGKGDAEPRLQKLSN